MVDARSAEPLGRADRGKGTPDGGSEVADVGVEEGKGGTRGVATGMAARFRRGRLCDEDLRGGRPPLPVPPSPDPGVPPPPAVPRR